MLMCLKAWTGGDRRRGPRKVVEHRLDVEVAWGWDSEVDRL